MLEGERYAAIRERFGELHPPLAPQAAVVEANRCLNCFDAPCTAACPTHIDVPRFIKKIATGNLDGSARTILDANVLGASCARVCPVEVLCEGACVMHGVHEKPIEIARLQRHAMDRFHARGGQLAKKHDVRPGRVACIGAGPASLACAAELAQQGFSVTVLDRNPLPGGLNSYGVAEYKLSAKASLEEIALIAALGVEFRPGVDVDAAALEALEAEYDLIFLGVGLGAAHALAIPGGDHPAVVDALRFIADYKTAKVTRVGGRVVVIGAGNTAMDAAIAARRLGAEEVSILYRRGPESMSAFAFEYEHAKQEGVRFLWQTAPVRVVAEDALVEYIQCTQVDEQLRPVAGSEFDLACDLIVPAIGQSPLLKLLGALPGLVLDGGRVVIEQATGETSHLKYFAGGDCVNGGREVVDAVADGKRAAQAMTAVLEARYA
ncbi:NAD(P)-dependent oxidoreductase [Silvibacterium dinghuense]|uniref:NAD(P)-dependent oxidoreductase n=2 Tax=Silvibacterium dinghuense TaxID=1560006 RepID=A0A4Q1SA28_9BACT|nr:NAD(P)-dependent oxidoreductase [Silvibacterium dinghuense]